MSSTFYPNKFVQPHAFAPQFAHTTRQCAKWGAGGVPPEGVFNPPAPAEPAKGGPQGVLDRELNSHSAGLPQTMRSNPILFVFCSLPFFACN